MATKLSKRPGARRIRVIGANPRKMGVRRAARPLPSVADFRSRYGARSIEVAARLRSKSRTNKAFQHWSRMIEMLEKRKPNPRKNSPKQYTVYQVRDNNYLAGWFKNLDYAKHVARRLHEWDDSHRITVEEIKIPASTYKLLRQ